MLVESPLPIAAMLEVISLFARCFPSVAVFSGKSFPVDESLRMQQKEIGLSCNTPGERTVKYFKFIGTMCALIMLLAVGSAFALKVTCRECREFDKQRARIQLELSRKERHMEKAFRKNEFRKVTGIRAEITELRRTLLKLKSKEPECKVACRPDVVKAENCRRIVREIVEIDKDELTTQEDRAKIDEKYNELATCNRELKKLQKIHMR